jgi:hypothetical protein
MKLLFENWRKYLRESEEAEPFDVLNLLSDEERQQLGVPKGGRSTFNYATEEQWRKIRDVLVQRSLSSNPLLDPEYVAYTPGETLKLMEKPVISKWHDEMKNFKVPEETDIVVFVPCAKTKPWVCGTNMQKKIGSRGYDAYNVIRGERGEGLDFYFVTISEPLGIVPEDRWHNFPQYDNPGLFKGTSDRVDRVQTRQWPKVFGMDKVITPYSTKDYQQSIDVLSDVIAGFMQANRDKEFASFVGAAADRKKRPGAIAAKGSAASTHTDMLNMASSKTGIQIARHLKTLVSRGDPGEPIRGYLAGKGKI